MELLTVPLNVRNLIYELLLQDPKSRPRSRIRRGWDKPRNFEIARFNVAHLPFLSCEDMKGPRTPWPTVFKNLRMCCKQLHAETGPRVALPLVNLTIMDNRLLEFSAAPETFDLLEMNGWLESRIRKVQIKVWYFGTTLVYTPPDEDMWFPYRDNDIPGARKDKKLTWPQSALTERGKSLSTFAEYLETLPLLEEVTLNVDPSGTSMKAFFEHWRDPLGDAEALWPLKERGVKVRLRANFGSENFYRNTPVSEAFKVELNELMEKKKFRRKMKLGKTDERSEWEFTET